MMGFFGLSGGALSEATNLTPVADFAFVQDGLTLTLTDASLDPDAGSIAAYLWDFGDGQTAITASPVHVYADAGDYTLSLTVTDAEGASNTKTQAITMIAPLSGMSRHRRQRRREHP